MDLSIKRIETSKDDIKQPYLAEMKVIPKITGRVIAVGHSGCGKSTLLANLLTRRDMLKNAFDRRILISPTAETDDIQKLLNIPSSDIVTDIKKAPEFLRSLQEEMKASIKEVGAARAPKTLVYFEDAASDGDLKHSKEFVDSFILSRHYNFTVFVCTQSYNLLPRVCRLQASNIFFFGGAMSEMEVLAEDRAPPGFIRKRMVELIKDATIEPYSFLHINMNAELKERYRKNLDELYVLV